MADLGEKAGDYVKIRLAKDEIEGTALESKGDVLMLKLKSGYNIGIAREKILGGKIVKRYNEKSEKKESLKKGKGKKSIGLIITGGTIASKLDTRTGAVKHLADEGELAKYYPELFDKVNVAKVSVPFMVASESMNSSHWAKIAESVKGMVNDPEIEGVIVTHGTDFLHYTAAALSFMLRDLSKPVVLTYSQRSIDRGSSDASLNLQCAAEFALSDCAEVVLVGHASQDDDYCYALRGTKCRKMHSSKRDAFKAINVGPVARVYRDKVEFLEERRPRNSEKTSVDSDYSDKVALVKFYPGQDPAILDYYALKYKGIVIEGSGLGHLPVSEAGHLSWLPKLKKHIRGGLVVCVATQCLYGRTDPYVYSNGRELQEAGVIFLGDILPEVGLIKLGWALGHHGFKKRIDKIMTTNIVGEINERLL
tara:strand:- start:468 stop:1733 length:1266 start_codon:yes stop_codon:yes gene_type:complete